ncbi:MAG: hypothetical protein V4719_25770 [Planctomycetota bacterium]
MINRITDDAVRATAAAAQQLEEGAAEVSANVQREAKKWLSQLEQQIIANPGLALGLAVAAGLTLGMLLKRK